MLLKTILTSAIVLYGVHAASISAECAAAMRNADDIINETRKSLNAYYDSNAQLKQSLGPTISQFNNADFSAYRMQEGQDFSIAQKQSAVRSGKQMKQIASTVQRFIKPTDSDSSDVIEDISILEFSIADVTKNCGASFS